MKNKKIKAVAYYLLCFALIISLSGCYDIAELEDRALVLAIGIDKGNAKDESSFNVLMEIPTNFELDEDNTSRVKAIEDKSVNGGMKKLDAYTGQELYYGHTKACILGEDILKDKNLFKQAIDGLERNREISRKLIIMTSRTSSEDILKASIDNNSLTGIFINDFYKNNSQSLNTTFRQDLEGLIKQLLASSNAVIPVIQNTDNSLKIGNLAVIKDYSLKGYLNDEQSRGFMFLSGYKLGGDLTIPFENSNTALKITDKNTTFNLTKTDDEHFKLIFDIAVEGNIEEYSLNKNIFVDSDKYKIIENECSLLI